MKRRPFWYEEESLTLKTFAVVLPNVILIAAADNAVILSAAWNGGNLNIC